MHRALGRPVVRVAGLGWPFSLEQRSRSQMGSPAQLNLVTQAAISQDGALPVAAQVSIAARPPIFLHEFKFSGSVLSVLSLRCFTRVLA